MRYILQYLQVQIGYRHPLKPAKVRRLSKITKTLQNVLACMERQLFHQQSKDIDIETLKTKLHKFEMAADAEIAKVFRLI